MDIEKLAQLNIIKELHFSDTPQEEQQEIITDATQIILESAVERMKEKLSPEKRREFARVFSDAASEEERAAFLKKNALNLPKTLLEETIRYKYLLKKITSDNT